MQSEIKVVLEKVGLNPKSRHALIDNDFSMLDNHPNVKMGETIEGVVQREIFLPQVGKSYYVFPIKAGERPTSTSKIVKVKNLLTFTTINSVYRIKFGRIFDFKYDIQYVPVHLFEFGKKNQIVDLTNYKPLENEIFRLVNILKADNLSRKAITVLCDNSNQPSCLISLQYLILPLEAGQLSLHCIANYRSQHAILGLPHDQSLLNYLTTIFLENFEKSFREIIISVNVADFHDYAI